MYPRTAHGQNIFSARHSIWYNNGKQNEGNNSNKVREKTKIPLFLTIEQLASRHNASAFLKEK